MLDETDVVERGIYRTHHHKGARNRRHSRDLVDDREVLEIRRCDSGLYSQVWVYFRRVDECGKPVPAWRRCYVSLKTFTNWADERIL